MRIKKRSILFLFAIALFAISIQTKNVKAETAQILSANSGYCGAEDNKENVTWEYDVRTKTLAIHGTGEMMSDVSEYPWTRLKASAERIVVSDGITNIGSAAFAGFLAKEVELGNTIEKIENDAFYSSGIQAIEIPGSVKEIGVRAFRECFYLEYVVLDEGVERIEDCAFERLAGYCEKGTVYMPATISYIHGSAFDNDWQKNLVVYGRNDIEKIYFTGTSATYVDATETFDLSQSEVHLLQNDLDAYAYTGEPVEPLESIIFSGEQITTEGVCSSVSLIENVDYTITYTNNVEAGMATFLVTGMGCYSGTTSGSFQIYKSIEDCEISIPQDSYLYSGEQQTPDINVSYNEGALEKEKDYTVSYTNNLEEGEATATVEGIGNFKGTKTILFTIYKKHIQKEDVSLENERYLYSGEEIKPVVIVKYNGEVVPEDCYSVEYKNNIEEGIGTIVINPIETKGYADKQEKEFEIYKNDIIDAEIAMENSMVIYTGEELTPDVNVNYNEVELQKDKDYTVSYTNNLEEGEATATVEGIGNFKGTKTIPFTIYKKDIGQAVATLSFSSVICDGTEKMPEVKVTDKDKSLIKDIDYMVSYADNITPGIAKVSITGKGIYKGTLSLTFEIEGISIENANVVLADILFTYDGSEKKPEASVILNGVTLTKDTDYKLSYENNIVPGTANAVIEGIGIYEGKVTQSFTILAYNAGMENVYDAGDTLISDDYVYMITDDEEKEVELSAIHNKTLKKVEVPATITDEAGVAYTVTSIGNKAFYKNTKITSVVIGNNVKSIEDYAFYGCKNIKSIKIGKALEMIGNSSFRKCTKLTSITLPKTLNELGKNAFYGCSKLKTITINANSVVDVQANAFKGISKKAVIKVPKKDWKKYKKEFDKSTGFKNTMKLKKK